jgi:hypothetical protein
MDCAKFSDFDFQADICSNSANALKYDNVDYMYKDCDYCKQKGSSPNNE